MTSPRPTPLAPADPFVVILAGEVDLDVAADLVGIVESFRASGAASATVDLRSVTFIDTAALTFLGRLREIALERGGSVTVAGASGAPLRTLTLVGFDTDFAIVA